MNDELLERYRQLTGPWKTTRGDNFGLFFIPTLKPPRMILKVICAPMDMEWQHVSVSLSNRCPSWEEMAMIKNLFWGEDETVIQFHPKKSEYINNHPYCLHLWKHVDGHALPPSILIGIKLD